MLNLTYLSVLFETWLVDNRIQENIAFMFIISASHDSHVSEVVAGNIIKSIHTIFRTVLFEMYVFWFKFHGNVFQMV